MLKEKFDARLDLVPTDPGVYLMKDDSGTVIYVGKAINLRRRLQNYFNPNPKGGTKVLAMIAKIASYEYLVVRNELEALLLESNLIKRYQPFYNILLKDDHDYPYIKVSVQEEYPKISKAYRIGPDEKEGARYYGPYLNADVTRALKIIRKLFPMKTFHRIFNTDRSEEEISLRLSEEDTATGKLDEIKKDGRLESVSISAAQPTMDPDEYRAIVDDVCKFLEGKYDSVRARMEAEMLEASSQMDFERAAIWRDRLHDLMRLQEKQSAVLEQNFNGDVIGLAKNSVEACIQKLEIREGRIIGTSTYFLDAALNSDEEIIAAFIVQYYSSASYIPSTILVPVENQKNKLDSEQKDEEAELEVGLLEFLRELADHKVDLHFPQRGEKANILKMANRNAKQALQRRTLIAGSNSESLTTALALLGRILELEHVPGRIEAYDISNTGSDDMVCGMAVFENGKAKRNDSRTFHIKRQEGQDDYSAMQEAIDRRLNHLGDNKFGATPDIILVDGGIGHVNAIYPVLASHGVAETIELAGMVKDQRHRTRGLALKNGEIIELAEALDILDNEKTYGSGRGLGIADGLFSTDKSTSRAEQLALLRLLSAIQNETHRIAGQANRKMNKKRQIRYKLEDIAGVGPARRKLLMKEFKSIKEISESTAEQIIERVPSISEAVAENIYQYFNADKNK